MDRVLTSKYPEEEDTRARPASFEETYPRYEFAEMVRIGLVLAEWIAAGANWLAHVIRRAGRSVSGMPSRPSPGEVQPAE